MAGRPQGGAARAQGNVEVLQSGALRVRVYAGIDPVTKKRHTLTEVIPPGPKAARLAEAARHRLIREVAERRNPRTSATVDQLLDRYLDQFDPETLLPFHAEVEVDLVEISADNVYIAEARDTGATHVHYDLGVQ